MDFRSRMKAILVGLTFLSMVTLLPHLYTSLRAFFMEFILSFVSVAVTPKCLFVLSNIIVVFLVSESKLSRRSSDPLNVDDNVAARDESVLHSQKQEVLVTEALLSAIPKDSRQGQEKTMVMEVDEEKDAATAVNEAVKMNQCEEEVFHSGVHQEDEVQEEVEEGRGDFALMLGGEVSGGAEQDCSAEEEVEERGLTPADELNRRVEDFIARFNMERQLEASMLVRCF